MGEDNGMAHLKKSAAKCYDGVMSMTKPQSLTIDPNLQVRLSALAERQGYTVSEFAERLLRAHADQAEREITEYAEDERRWQRYLETGTAVSFDTVRNKLRHLAAEAAREMEPQ